MSDSLRVDPDFFEDFLNEDSYTIRRRRRDAGRHRRTRQTVRPDRVHADVEDMGLTSTVTSHFEPGPRIFV